MFSRVLYYIVNFEVIALDSCFSCIIYYHTAAFPGKHIVNKRLQTSITITLDYSLEQIAFAVFQVLFAITQLLFQVNELLTSAYKQA